MSNTIIHERKGIIFAIIASLCSGLAGITDKLGSVLSQQPFLYSTETIFFSFFFTIIYFFFSSKKQTVKSYYKKLTVISLIQVVAIGIFASGIVILLRFIGLLQSTGTFASLSQVITTSITVILAHFFLKERLSRNFWLFFFIIIIATYFVSVGNFSLVSLKRGDIFILCSTVFLAISNIITKNTVHKIEPVLVATGRFLFGFIFLFLVSFLFLYNSTTFSFNIFAILSGLIWSINVILFNIAIKQIGATLTTSLLMLSPIVTMIIEATLLSYRFTQLQYVAALVIIGSGIIIALKRNKF